MKKYILDCLWETAKKRGPWFSVFTVSLCVKTSLQTFQIDNPNIPATSRTAPCCHVQTITEVASRLGTHPSELVIYTKENSQCVQPSSGLLLQAMCKMRHFPIKQVLCLTAGWLGYWRSAHNIWESFCTVYLGPKPNSGLGRDVWRQSSFREPKESQWFLSSPRALSTLALTAHFECFFFF